MEALKTKNRVGLSSLGTRLPNTAKLILTESSPKCLQNSACVSELFEYLWRTEKRSKTTKSPQIMIVIRGLLVRRYENKNLI